MSAAPSSRSTAKSSGANMENLHYRLGICAEQSAITAAQHEFGLDKVARVAVAGGGMDQAESTERRSALHAAAAARRFSKRRS